MSYEPKICEESLENNPTVARDSYAVTAYTYYDIFDATLLNLSGTWNGRVWVPHLRRWFEKDGKEIEEVCDNLTHQIRQREARFRRAMDGGWIEGEKDG